MGRIKFSVCQFSKPTVAVERIGIIDIKDIVDETKGRGIRLF
ncbi:MULTISPECIES: hypothetical protein [Peribacillus]|nr:MULTISPECIES: hypothetical protein [unclassified Peribacillus]